MGFEPMTDEVNLKIKFAALPSELLKCMGDWHTRLHRLVHRCDSESHPSNHSYTWCLSSGMPEICIL
jgi:hypothetical protein